MSENILVDKKVSKEEKYIQLLPQLEVLVSGEPDLIANMANISSALKEVFNFWWVGFYIAKDNELVLGPFQGPIACTRISLGRGVCGASFMKQKTIIVPDVNEFPDHIACSSATKSEIVIPLFQNKTVIGVLDIDSQFLNYFDDIDKLHLEKVSKLFSN